MCDRALGYKGRKAKGKRRSQDWLCRGRPLGYKLEFREQARGEHALRADGVGGEQAAEVEHLQAVG